MFSTEHIEHRTSNERGFQFGSSLKAGCFINSLLPVAYPALPGPRNHVAGWTARTARTARGTLLRAVGEHQARDSLENQGGVGATFAGRADLCVRIGIEPKGNAHGFGHARKIRLIAIGARLFFAIDFSPGVVPIEAVGIFKLRAEEAGGDFLTAAAREWVRRDDRIAPTEQAEVAGGRI